MMRVNTPMVNPHVVLREEFDDWAVLFNPDTGEAQGMNPVGVAIWKLLNGQRSLEDIIAEIHHRFDDVSSTAPQEIQVFIDTLAAQGFVGYAFEASR